MGKQWKNPPVYFVIVQVRFNAVLDLASYLAKIQEDFRKAEFTDFKKLMNASFNLGLLAGLKPGDGQPMQQNERYLFGNQEGTELFILDPNSLTFQTTRYKTFEILTQTFLPRMENLAKLLSLSFSDRIGLRYLDAVMPGPGETLESYVIPQVLGVRGRVNGEMQHSFTEALFSVPEGKLLSRVVVQDGPVGFPPDLIMLGSDLKLGRRFAEHLGQYAVIDTDGFNDTRDRVDNKTIQERIRGLHDQVDAVFNAIITKHAIKMWS
jgi:uncharacterized protein (TIGR04255 family)